MFEVYFESNKEAITFCQRLFHYDKHFKINWRTSQEWGNQIRIEVTNALTEQQHIIAKAMTDVFIHHREITWVKNIISNTYYFRNKEEIHRIIELARSVINDSSNDIAKLDGSCTPRDLLVDLFLKFTTSEKIHYDSIVNFRLQHFKVRLTDLIGLAIDEFKREEEYQSFIESLREYMLKKETSYSTVHLVQGNNFGYYKSDGRPFSTAELKMIVKKEPLYIVGLDEDELNLTPLLALAPKEIIIYGEHPSEAKTLAVINIFQEKVKFKSLDKFPYPMFLKSE